MRVRNPPSSLTATGESFARHALTVLQDQERLRVELQGLSAGWIGTVRIAGVEALNMSFLPELIRRHRVLAPQVGFTVTTMGSLQVQGALVDGACDVGIAFALRHSPELRQVALARFRLGAVVAAGHPLADRPSLTLAGCIGTPAILATAELSIRQLLEPSLARLPHLPVRCGCHNATRGQLPARPSRPVAPPIADGRHGRIGRRTHCAAPPRWRLASPPSSGN